MHQFILRMLRLSKKKLVLAFVFFAFCAFPQSTDQEYFNLCRKGFGFYEVKKYHESTEAYTKAFQLKGAKIKGSDRYDAACSWALAGYPDSAFTQLYLAATKDTFDDYYHIIRDPDLNSLQKDKRWKPLLDSIQTNKEKKARGLDGHLTRLLESVLYSDQRYREMLDVYEKKYGFNSKEVKTLWDSIKKQDDANLKIITHILDTYGWLGPDVVGENGNSALFLVIQHSDQKTQEKYLPMMREAVKKGKAQGSSLALLEDRVALKQGKKQIYGSQLSQDPETGKYALSPIEDEASVNKRRAEVGLEPIEEYVKYWGIVYKPAINPVENASFWVTYKTYILLVVTTLTYILICLLLTRIFKMQLLTSAFFWFYSLIFFMSLLSWHKELNGPQGFFLRKDALKSLLSHLANFLILFGSTCLINYGLYRLFKRKHLAFELLAVSGGAIFSAQS